MNTRLSRLLIGTSVIIVLLSSTPARAADDPALRKEVMKLNDLVGDDAIDARIEALTKDPAHAKKLLATAAGVAKEKELPFNYNAAYILASTARELRDLDNAKLFYKLCLDRAEKLKSDSKISSTYMEMVDLHFENRKLDEAEKICKEFLERPGDSDELKIGHMIALLRMVRITAMRGKTEEAFKLLEPLQKAGPDEPVIIDTHAWLLRYVGRYDDAIKAYEQVLEKLDNEDLKERIRYGLSNLYTEIGNIDKAAEQLQILLKKKPDDPGYNNDLGYIWADHDKNLDEAEKLIRKAVEKEPKNASYIDSLAWVLFKKKQFKEAKDLLAQALQDPRGQHTEIYDHLGDVHHALGEKADAVSAWKKAVDVAGTSKREQKRKAEIEKKIKENQ